MSTRQHNLIKLGVPPSLANGLITLPLTTATQVNADLQQLGLTAEDLRPIDWRKKVNLSVVKNQEICGDCWAQSSTSALADRFIIQKNISNLDLNAVITTQCATNDVGCNGSSPQVAGEFFERAGTVIISNNCPQLTDFFNEADKKARADLEKNKNNICAGKNKDDCQKAENVYYSQKLTKYFADLFPKCSDIDKTCLTGKYDLYRAKHGSTRSLPVIKDGKIDNSQTIINMKKELVNGPYPVCFLVAKDFEANFPGGPFKWQKTNGIYINGAYNDVISTVLDPEHVARLGVTNPNQWGDIQMEGSSPAAHAVELVGWDIGDAGPGYGKIPYWIIKNSWGDSWNEEGYFKIAMNMEPHNYNKYLGLDIPVFDVVIASTGRKIPAGGAFGGGTAFDPDLSTGAGKGHKYPGGKSKSSKSSMSSKIIYIIAGIIGFLILIGVVAYFVHNKTPKRLVRSRFSMRVRR